jgi:nucleotide-binding universal stress UspA family protein
LTYKKRAAFRKRWRATIAAGIHGSNMKTQNVRNILVPIDFSKMSIQAIETAKRLAQRFGATVHLAHVHQFDYPAEVMPPAPPFIPFSVVSYDEDAEKRLSWQLHDLARKHDLLNSGTCHIQTGAPAFDEICRLARDIRADLIVMPTHGYTGLKHVFLGSTAERIVQHSPCPVFVSRQRERRFDKILVPVDFSGCSLDGLKYAISFAERFAAKIIMLHAVELGYVYAADGYAMYDLSELTEAARKHAERQMREFVRLTSFGPVKFDTVIRTGSPVEEICAFAKDEDVDLIITATHGRTGLKHVLIGSTAERVVRHAPCAVLVVPSHPKMRAAELTPGAGRARQSRGRAAKERQQKPIESEQLTKRYRKLVARAFPERRNTNKFRESHLA